MKKVRIQTLIVTGIVAIICLFIPDGAFANDHGKQGNFEKNPNTNQEDVGNKRSENNSKSDHTSNAQNDHAKSKSEFNKERPRKPTSTSTDQSNHASVDADLGSENRSTKAQKKSSSKNDFNKISNKTKQSETGRDIHKDRNEKSPVNQESLITDHNQEKTIKARIQSDAASKASNNESKVKIQQSDAKTNQKPIPEGNPAKQPPVVTPTTSSSQLTKTGMQGDGNSTNTSSGFFIYGLSILASGTLISIDGDFVSDYRKEHNQWINAPPSPPPKSNLLLNV